MDNYAHAADVVRRRDRDRYLADLYAPAGARNHLFALHAYALEIARVRDAVSEPTLGEIRLQWWRDAIANRDASGHPIAAAVIETVRAFDLPVAALDTIAEARVFDLYDDPMPTTDDLEGYAGETTSAMLQLSAIVLNGGKDTDSADASGHAGVAETMVGVLRMLATNPSAAAKYFPEPLLAEHGATRPALVGREATPPVLAAVAALRAVAWRHLAEGEGAVNRLPGSVAPAYLPLSVASARLHRMERETNPFEGRDVPAWRRQWTIWQAARRQS